ncbi:MAG: hypothetical protein HY226_03690 [Candidatus Vogelbacteria bacterium]|nr:hypothetical protein [Candidatus Vogelbacteria bacterium]
MTRSSIESERNSVTDVNDVDNSIGEYYRIVFICVSCGNEHPVDLGSD